MIIYAIGTSAKDALSHYWAGGYETLEEAQLAIIEECAADPKGEYFIYRIDVEVVQK